MGVEVGLEKEVLLTCFSLIIKMAKEVEFHTKKIKDFLACKSGGEK